MARTDAVVLGAGIVGTSVALHLAKRGLSVALVDRRAPGEETSYGNAVLTRPVVDPEIGYCLAPMEQGIRLTTGAEFAPRDAPPTPVQIGRASCRERV